MINGTLVNWASKTILAVEMQNPGIHRWQVFKNSIFILKHFWGVPSVIPECSGPALSQSGDMERSRSRRGVFVWIIRQSEWNMEPDCCRNLYLSGALYCRCVLLTSSLTALSLTVFSLTSSLTTMSSLAPDTPHFKGANIEDFACIYNTHTWTDM